MAPQGKIGVIENPATPLDIVKLKPKCLSLHWEFMFARPLYQTPDMAEQGRLLNEVSRLVDAGLIRSTSQINLGEINAANLRKAHALVESGKTMGKVVLSGFPERLNRYGYATTAAALYPGIGRAKSSAC